MNKISLQELKSMYGGVSGKYRPQSATKPGFAHVVNLPYKPPKGITPKQWEEQQKSFKMMTQAKNRKTLRYQCPECLVPMEKLGYCQTHKKWASLISVKENK